MTIYKLTTNERTTFVHSSDARLRQVMYEYIRKKRLAGVALADIIFTWSHIYVTKI